MTRLYRCKRCNYIYDPGSGDQANQIQPGVPFDDLPDSWGCPVCGAKKDEFVLD